MRMKRAVESGMNVEVYKKNGKWCLKIGDKEFCEGDIIRKKFGDDDVWEYELRFGCAIIPDNESYADNFVVGFYFSEKG